jgi:competence protein ComEC
MKTTTAVFLSALLALSYLSVSLVPTAASQTSSNVTVHFIDVGQGDSIFIDTPNRDVLIDGGSASASQTVLDYLDSLNITIIHLLIATHAHEDHIGGLVDILDSSITISEVLVNNQTYTSATYTNFIARAQTRNLTVAQRGQTFTLTETANLTVLNPVQPLEFSDLNDNSIVVKLQAGNISFLFAGDAEEPAEQSIIDAELSLHSDVLKVGHHGSSTATSQAFLDLVDPTYAVISAGLDNKYGHPHNETIQKLLAKGVTIYGTYISGTIVASTDGTAVTFQGNPQPIPEFLSNLTAITTLVTATLLALVAYRKKLQNARHL